MLGSEVGVSVRQRLETTATRVQVALLAVLAAALVLLLSGGDRDTPNPTSVTIAGSLQSEAGCRGDWDPGLRGDAPRPTTRPTTSGRARSRCPPASYEYKAALNNTLGRELRPARAPNGANIPLDLAVGGERQVLLRPQDPLGHRQQELGDRGRARELPVRARLPGRLGSGLPALVARGSRRRRHLHVRDDRAARRARTRRRSRSTRAGTRTTARAASPDGAEHPVHRPGRQREGHVQLRRDDARAHGHASRADRRARRPGALSHFDLARKDCLGTARNTTSKVWFTVAGGVLSDVYYPTVDNTNVETLQYVVTDGSTFTDLQTRDMTYTVEAVARHRRDGVRGDRDGEERQVHDRDRVRHRSRPEHAC